MGKKRVLKEVNDQTAQQEVEALNSAMKKGEDSAVVKKVSTRGGRIYIQVSYNNVRVSATDSNGKMLAWSTSGHLRFKGPKKATPFAAAQVTENLLQKIQKIGLSEFDVFVKGIGGGRDSALRTLVAKGVNIISISDRTGIPHGGCRPPRLRRL